MKHSTFNSRIKELYSYRETNESVKNLIKEIYKDKDEILDERIQNIINKETI